MFRHKLLTSVAAFACAVAMQAGAASAQTTTPTTTLRPFYGDISPFYGDISPFYGDISPFWGDISPFWGDISPFYGDISAFWGDISPFYGDISPFYGDIAPFWDSMAPTMEGLQGLAPGANANTRMSTLVSQSQTFWGPTVTARTGKTFLTGFARPLFTKYGLGANGEGFGALSDPVRARFLFDWYDGLMSLSGRDHVDYWMGNVNWSPNLADQVGGGQGITIGLLDALTLDLDILNKSIDAPGWVWWGESSTTPVGGHGAAVASLMLADHDGRGVMGMAPNAGVALYNPYDATNTTNWDTVARGMNVLYQSGASVYNLSLGVPGYALHPDWGTFYNRFDMRGVVRNSSAMIADLFQVAPTTYSGVFVHAAGNEGASQTANVNWNFSINPAILVVGSVGPTGQISSFSNRPGNACLMNGTTCQERLMNRFLVAPGEWVLVSDGNGGVTRQSGTSFAAPQVSGAVALVQGRWPWLRDYAIETADILLRSATDLGAPGVDPVYGRGMLNVEASQSPLSMASLYQRSATGEKVTLTTSGGGSLLGASSGYVVVYEDIGGTYRDFRVPLGANAATTFVSDPLRAYVSNLRVLQTSTSTSTAAKPKSSSTTSSSSRNRSSFDNAAWVANPFGLDMRMQLSPLPMGEVAGDGELPYAMDMALIGENVTLLAGHGAGALALTGQPNTDAMSYSSQWGGANPILGFASGDGYAAFETRFGAGFSLTAGFTARDYQAMQANPITGEEAPFFEGFDAYRSNAAHALLRKTISDGFSVSASYTYLSEQNGLLGLQSANPETFQAGTETDAATFGFDWSPSDRISLAAAATFGRTRAQDSAAQSFAIGEEGVETSAYEATLTLNGVFARSDAMRLRVVQPLHVDGGSLNVTNIEVTDRNTGALGPVTQSVGLGAAERQYFVEGMYTTSILDGDGQFGVFARFDASERGAEEVEEVIGASVQFSF